MDPRNEAWQEVSDPNTPAERLREIAAQYPDFWAAIVHHPHASPDLTQWINSQPAGYGSGQPGGSGSAPGEFGTAGQEPTYGTGYQAYPPNSQNPQGYPPNYQDPQGYPAYNQNPQGYPAYNQNPQGYPPSYQDPQGYPGGPYPQGYAGAQVSEKPRKSRRTKIIVAVIATIVALALIFSLVYWLAFGRKLNGADSPEEAVEMFITAAVEGDGVSLYGSIAPSEITPIRDLFEHSVEVQERFKNATESPGDATDIGDVWKAMDIKVEGLEFDEVEIADGIVRVEVLDGTIRTDGDKEEVARLWNELAEQNADTSGLSPAEVDELLYELQRDLFGYGSDDVWPIEIDISYFSDYSNDSVNGIPMVAVEENGNWYFSPLLSFGEFIRIDYESSYYNPGPYRYGTIPDAAPADTPEESVQTLARGLEDMYSTGDPEQFIASLPLAERRFLGLHSTLFDGLNSSKMGGNGRGATGIDLEITGGGKIVSTTDDQAILLPDNFVVAVSDEPYGSGEIRLNELCVEINEPSGYSESYCLDQVVEENIGAYTNIDIDLSNLGFVSVKQDGNWHFSFVGSGAQIIHVLFDNMRPELLSELGYQF